jgi:hypothetical protein
MTELQRGNRHDAGGHDHAEVGGDSSANPARVKDGAALCIG